MEDHREDFLSNDSQWIGMPFEWGNLLSNDSQWGPSHGHRLTAVSADNILTQSRIEETPHSAIHGVHHTPSPSIPSSLSRPASNLLILLSVCPHSSVDYRATCFCHRNVVDLGFVCPVCLSG